MPNIVAPLIARYSPAIHLGMTASEAHAAFPALSLGDVSRASDVPGATEFSVSLVLLNPSLKERLLRELELGSSAPAGTVGAIILTTLSAQATDSALWRVRHTLGAEPLEGCGGWPDVAVDRVLSWRIEGGGGVMMTIPHFRAPGGRFIAQLVFFAGKWRPDMITFEYHDGSCTGAVR